MLGVFSYSFLLFDCALLFFFLPHLRTRYRSNFVCTRSHSWAPPSVYTSLSVSTAAIWPLLSFPFDTLPAWTLVQCWSVHAPLPSASAVNAFSDARTWKVEIYFLWLFFIVAICFPAPTASGLKGSHCMKGDLEQEVSLTPRGTITQDFKMIWQCSNLITSGRVDCTAVCHQKAVNGVHGVPR